LGELTKIYWSTYNYLGHTFILASTDKGVCRVQFPHEGMETLRHWTARHFPGALLTEDRERFTETVRQLDEYFHGKRERFSLPLDMRGTAFQIAVWRELSRIPYGQVRSYGEIAKEIGSPKAARAVGTASGANPIPILVPCHRVIGSSGTLTGFRGGLKMKELLLEREGIHGYRRSGHARFDF
jgi:methylated-DNA-[protein]-cysteine S-methyltransferase